MQSDISTTLYLQHLAILRATRDGDPQAAMADFKRHLDFIEEKLRQILEVGDKIETPASEA